MSFQSWPSIQSLSQAAMAPPSSSQPAASGASRLSNVSGRPAHSMFARPSRLSAQAPSHQQPQPQFQQRQTQAAYAQASSDTAVSFDAVATPPFSQRHSRPATSGASRYRPTTAPELVQPAFQQQQELFESLHDTTNHIYGEVVSLRDQRQQDEARMKALAEELRDGQAKAIEDHQMEWQKLRDDVVTQMKQLVSSVDEVRGRVEALEERQKISEDRQKISEDRQKTWQDDIKRSQTAWQEANRHRQSEGQVAIQRQLEQLQELYARQEKGQQDADQRQQALLGQSHDRIVKALARIEEAASRQTHVPSRALERHSTPVRPASSLPSTVCPYGSGPFHLITPELFAQLFKQHFDQHADALQQGRQTIGDGGDGSEGGGDCDEDDGRRKTASAPSKPAVVTTTTAAPQAPRAYRWAPSPGHRGVLPDPDAAGDECRSEADAEAGAVAEADQPEQERDEAMTAPTITSPKSKGMRQKDANPVFHQQTMRPDQRSANKKPYNLRGRARQLEDPRPSTSAGILLNPGSWTDVAQTKPSKPSGAKATAVGASRSPAPKETGARIYLDTRTAIGRSGKKRRLFAENDLVLNDDG